MRTRFPLNHAFLCDRIRWKGIEGRSLFGEAGFDSEIVFVPDVPE
jgi:hypothetical protein